MLSSLSGQMPSRRGKLPCLQRGMKGSGHCIKMSPLFSHATVASRELLNRKLVQTRVPPPPPEQGPLVTVAPSPLGAVCCALLCFLSVVTYQWLPGEQGQPAACSEPWPGMHAFLGTSRPLSLPHTQLSAATFQLSSQKSRARLPLGLKAGNGAGVCSLPPCSWGMALQQCPREAGAQGLPPKAGERRKWPAGSSQPSPDPCPAPVPGTQWCIVGWGQRRGTGRRPQAGETGPAVLPVLQHPLTGQVPCTPWERGPAKDGLDQGACVFPDACRVPSPAWGWGRAPCLLI